MNITKAFIDNWNNDVAIAHISAVFGSTDKKIFFRVI